MEEVDDKELIELSSKLAGEALHTQDHYTSIQVGVVYWMKLSAIYLICQIIGL